MPLPSIPVLIGLSIGTTGASSVAMGYGYTSGAYLGYASWNTSDPLGVQASKRRYISPKSHISVPYGYRRRYYGYRRYNRYWRKFNRRSYYRRRYY